MNLILYTFFFLLVVFVGVYVHLRRKVTSHIPNNFPNEENRSLLVKNKKVIVCFGDSNTHGNVSYDWVSDLINDLPNFQTFNAGLNSDLSFSLLKRLEDVILCEPDFITIMIGTNDIKAAYAKKSLKRYISTGKISKNEIPNLTTFEKNLTKIVEIFQLKTKAKIALMTLPLMGEDLKSEINKIADSYSEVIKKVSFEYKINCLPIRSQQKEYLTKNPSLTPFRFEQYFILLNKSVLLHYIFGFSWDKISNLHKTQLSPDFLHQNSKAGKMIKEQVLNWINK